VRCIATSQDGGKNPEERTGIVEEQQNGGGKPAAYPLSDPFLSGKDCLVEAR
jgi:hypothetical protein